MNSDINVLHPTTVTCDVLYLRIFTLAHAAPLLKKRISVKPTTFFILKNKPIQTKMSAFSENKFKIKL